MSCTRPKRSLCLRLRSVVNQGHFAVRVWCRCGIALLFVFCMNAQGQEPWTWVRVRARFEQSNPTLLADKLNIDESKAQEITANLRPNPEFTLLTDGTQI